MILLLDTHSLLRWLADDATLQADARDAIASPANDVLASAAALEQSSITGLPITVADAETAGALPALHRDPFDRMLVAQARRLGAIVVTRDPVFSAYGIDTLAA